MIHYHGCPITPYARLNELTGRFFCNSFASPSQTEFCHQVGQGNMLDNGAFTFWKGGREPDWRKWAEWAARWLDFRTTWAVLPDAIDGGAEENDRLLREWGASGRDNSDQCAPVWHLDEPIYRLVSLCEGYKRVCFGSAGMYASVGTQQWRERVADAFDAIADVHGRVPWIHMLRGMSMSGDVFPFSSVDSTDIARNHHLAHKDALVMARRWDAMQCPARWDRARAEMETA